MNMDSCTVKAAAIHLSEILPGDSLVADVVGKVGHVLANLQGKSLKEMMPPEHFIPSLNTYSSTQGRKLDTERMNQIEADVKAGKIKASEVKGGGTLPVR